jgi:hypothetical protein
MDRGAAGRRGRTVRNECYGYAAHRRSCELGILGPRLPDCARRGSGHPHESDRARAPDEIRGRRRDRRGGKVVESCSAYRSSRAIKLDVSQRAAHLLHWHRTDRPAR